MSSVYSFRNVCQRYNGRVVLSVESLDIPAGNIVGIVGPNGSGKSTLMRLMAFLESPDCGTLLFEGVPAAGQGADPAQLNALRKQVTLLTQEPYLLHRTVAENVAYGLQVRGERNTHDKVVAVLETVGLEPAEFMQRQWFELSGGEAQRVALASRIVLRPKVLLLDEPTSSLDEESSERIRAVSLAMREQYGTTLVIVSHDAEWLATVSDCVVRVRKGHLLP